MNNTFHSEPSFFKQHKLLLGALLLSVFAHLCFLGVRQWDKPTSVGPSKNKVMVTFVSKSEPTMTVPPQDIVVNVSKPLPVKNKTIVSKKETSVVTSDITTSKTNRNEISNENIFDTPRMSPTSVHKEVSENTKDYLYAQYFDDWKKKVERIGTMNYPQDVQSATLVLKVVLRADGSVESVRVVRSSGNKAADDAAINTVNFAAPFAKFPPEMKQQVKYLDITKTWSFNKNKVETR